MAAEYSGVGQKRLKDLAKGGLITGFQDPDSKRGDWVFDRYSLDEYREGQATKSQRTRVEVVDILKGCDLS